MTANEPDGRVTTVEAVLMVGSGEDTALGNNPDRAGFERVAATGQRLEASNLVTVDQDVATIAANDVTRDAISDLGKG
jgi:hypothetical protein